MFSGQFSLKISRLRMSRLWPGKNVLDAAIRERHNVEKEGKLAQSGIVEAN